MDAEESLREGRLEEALTDLQGRIRGAPSNSKYRVFLFQLLAVMGQWDRALTQLNVVGELDASALMMVQAYREALRCEVFRSEVFAGERTPLVFGEPAQWVALMIEAARLDAHGQHSQAQDLRQQALDAAPASSGAIDGESFEWIADADSRLGPILEAIVNGRYYWIPFQNIKEIQIEPPSDLRDFVWAPAHFVWANSGDAVGLIPSRYPASEASDDNSLRLARRTVWNEHTEQMYAGLGQRMFATEADEYPMLDVRAISLNTQAMQEDSSG